jgi:hypothetical protein
MYELSLTSADHIRHYSMCPVAPAGWEVIVKHDRSLRQHEVYHDWHRVERVLARFEREGSELVASGWEILRRVSR